MTTSTLTWQGGRSPTALHRDIEAYAKRIETAALAVAERLATALADEARAAAPWQDQTGDARRGLFGAAEIAGDMLTIYLSHGVTIDYGVFLETKHGERFAVIWPTINAHMDAILSDIRRELGATS